MAARNIDEIPAEELLDMLKKTDGTYNKVVYAIGYELGDEKYTYQKVVIDYPQAGPLRDETPFEENVIGGVGIRRGLSDNGPFYDSQEKAESVIGKFQAAKNHFIADERLNGDATDLSKLTAIKVHRALQFVPDFD